MMGMKKVLWTFDSGAENKEKVLYEESPVSLSIAERRTGMGLRGFIEK